MNLWHTVELAYRGPPVPLAERHMRASWFDNNQTRTPSSIIGDSGLCALGRCGPDRSFRGESLVVSWEIRVLSCGAVRCVLLPCVVLQLFSRGDGRLGYLILYIYVCSLNGIDFCLGIKIIKFLYCCASSTVSCLVLVLSSWVPEK